MKPQTLKGFRDFLPEDMKPREYVVNTFKKVFARYGYEPLETPTLEYSELMLGISGKEAEKQFYRFRDNGGRDVMMRYEVMVPMCRVIAQYRNEITFPFKRYQIQRCWRAENTQRGRLREFTQCDADTIGTSSMVADAEFIQMGTDVLKEFGFEDFVTLINNRKLLSGLIQLLKIDPDRAYGVWMSVDKLRKVGPEKVKEELTEKRGLSAEQAESLLSLLGTSGETNELLTFFGEKTQGISDAEEGLAEIEKIVDYLKAAEVEEKYYRFDPSIARGLAHYTGPIWEVEIKEGGVGSVAGCGRYDNVIGNYLGGKEQIPATGGSFGIERMMEILKDRGMASLPKSYAWVLVAIFDKELTGKAIQIAKLLRDEGVPALLYPNTETDLAKQLQYVNRKGIPYVVILGPEEVREDRVTLRDMRSSEQRRLLLEEAVEIVKADRQQSDRSS